jgi:hypothetical protein
VRGNPGEEEDAISVPTYGEILFESYLKAHDIEFEREPELPGIPERIDFVIDHPTWGKILLDVKDIENPPPGLGFGAFDPYRPIRMHIDAGRKKFRNCADYLCGLVLAAPPNSFVMLDDPLTMMGAMYGDPGFQMSFNTKTGVGDPETLRPIYIPGKGKMIRKTEVQNRRIAALIVIINHHIWSHAMRKYLNTEDGRTRQERYFDIQNGEAGLPDDDLRLAGVTVWENAVASKKLPKDLFRGEMDAWWEATEDGRQRPTFIGGLRRELQVDKAALEKLETE